MLLHTHSQMDRHTWRKQLEYYLQLFVAKELRKWMYITPRILNARKHKIRLNKIIKTQLLRLKRQFCSTTKSNQFVLIREVIVAYSENYKKNIYTHFSGKTHSFLISKVVHPSFSNH